MGLAQQGFQVFPIGFGKGQIGVGQEELDSVSHSVQKGIVTSHLHIESGDFETDHLLHLRNFGGSDGETARPAAPVDALPGQYVLAVAYRPDRNTTGWGQRKGTWWVENVNLSKSSRCLRLQSLRSCREQGSLCTVDPFRMFTSALKTWVVP